MKKLLVGATFADDSPEQLAWLDLQLKFLQATTDNFDHVVVVPSGELQNETFQRRVKVLLPPPKPVGFSEAHVRGLETLLAYFRDHKDGYDNFLFLDSDAFPIRKNWLRSLLNKMQPQNRFEGPVALSQPDQGRQYDIAVNLRCENLETRLHASVLFAKRVALEYLSFESMLAGDDLAGNPESDICIPRYQTERRRLALPLIRTNRVNIHPLACGVYFDTFYHHCCGSGRNFNLRAMYFLDRVVQPIKDVSVFTRRLMDDPNRFVADLAGWNPDLYARIDWLANGQAQK